VVNFQAHPTIMMPLGFADLSRDFPGRVTDMLESALPPVTALYVQGSCGDVNFDARWNHASLCYTPAEAVGSEALRVAILAQPAGAPRGAFS